MNDDELQAFEQEVARTTASLKDRSGGPRQLYADPGRVRRFRRSTRSARTGRSCRLLRSRGHRRHRDSARRRRSQLPLTACETLAGPVPRLATVLARRPAGLSSARRGDRLPPRARHRAVHRGSRRKSRTRHLRNRAKARGRPRHPRLRTRRAPAAVRPQESCSTSCREERQVRHPRRTRRRREPSCVGGAVRSLRPWPASRSPVSCRCPGGEASRRHLCARPADRSGRASVLAGEPGSLVGACLSWPRSATSPASSSSLRRASPSRCCRRS